ncbi:MAG TPA: hypothetical protein VFY36_02610, partial [Solirubrobacteraceae bacterium]|nr:hypothetical protein [Solirubrobacteraceae bacterium]
MAIALTAIGCGGGAVHPSSTNAEATAIQEAQRNIAAVCASSHGGAEALDRDLSVLIAAATKQHNPAIAQGSDAILRGGPPGKECGPGYADEIDVELLSVTPRQTVESAGLPTITASQDEAYYADHYGAGESESARTCVIETVSEPARMVNG